MLKRTQRAAQHSKGVFEGNANTVLLFFAAGTLCLNSVEFAVNSLRCVSAPCAWVFPLRLECGGAGVGDG